MTRARGFLVVPIAALLALSLASCGGGSSGPQKVPSDAVAIVGSEPITRVAFDEMLVANRQADRIKGQAYPAPGTAAFRTASNTIVDQLVQEVQFEQQAKSTLGIEISDQQVDRQVAQMKHQYFGDSEARFRASLVQQGVAETQLRARLRQQLLGQKVYAALSAKVKVTNADVETYYREHLAGYKQPARRQVRHILLKTKAQADRVERLLKNGGDFAALAETYSIDTSTRTAGGRLAGGITRGQTLPAFDRMAFSLKTNAISPPVHTRYGWHIIQPTSDVMPASTTPLSSVRPAIEAQLLAVKKQNAMTNWVNDAKTAFASRIAYAPGYGPAAKPGAGG